MSPLFVYGNNWPWLPAPPHTTAFSRVFCAFALCNGARSQETINSLVTQCLSAEQLRYGAKYERAGVILVKAKQKLLQPLVKILLFLSKHIYWKSVKECKNVLTNSTVVPRSEFLE